MVRTYGFGDVIRRLRDEGFSSATPDRLRHGMEAGHVPKPTQQIGGRFVYGERDIERFRHYLLNLPKPGRKPSNPRQATSVEA